MLTLGPVSSVFDFLRFYVLLVFFYADATLFHAGWFVESIASQVLVIFVIRTRGNPFAIRPSGWLLALSNAVVLTAGCLLLMPIAEDFGIAPLSAQINLAIVGIVALYLLCMQVVTAGP